MLPCQSTFVPMYVHLSISLFMFRNRKKYEALPSTRFTWVLLEFLRPHVRTWLLIPLCLTVPSTIRLLIDDVLKVGFWISRICPLLRFRHINAIFKVKSKYFVGLSKKNAEALYLWYLHENFITIFEEFGTRMILFDLLIRLHLP